MARRNDHSREELRQLALDAARFIIEAQGLAALSARKVAARMGYTVGTLYLVFSNLDDIIGQANSQTLAELNAALDQAAASEQDPAARIQALADAYVSFATRHTRRWSALYEHGIEADIALPHYVSEQLAASYALVEELLRPLAPQRPAGETAEAARALWGGVQGICILALSDKLGIARAEALPDVARNLIGNFLSGFGTPA